MLVKTWQNKLSASRILKLQLFKYSCINLGCGGFFHWRNYILKIQNMSSYCLFIKNSKRWQGIHLLEMVRICILSRNSQKLVLSYNWIPWHFFHPSPSEIKFWKNPTHPFFFFRLHISQLLSASHWQSLGKGLGAQLTPPFRFRVGIRDGGNSAVPQLQLRNLRKRILLCEQKGWRGMLHTLGFHLYSHMQVPAERLALAHAYQPMGAPSAPRLVWSQELKRAVARVPS